MAPDVVGKVSGHILVRVRGIEHTIDVVCGARGREDRRSRAWSRHPDGQRRGVGGVAKLSDASANVGQGHDLATRVVSASVEARQQGDVIDVEAARAVGDREAQLHLTGATERDRHVVAEQRPAAADGWNLERQR